MCVQDIEHPVSELNLDVGAPARRPHDVRPVPARARQARRRHQRADLADRAEPGEPVRQFLKKVLDGIPMSLAEFFTLDFTASPQVFFRGDELAVMGDRSVTYKLVAPRGPIVRWRCCTSTRRGRTPAPTCRRRGEEGGVVVRGHIELTVGAETRQLGPGDAYYFTSAIPHRFRNTGPNRARSSRPTPADVLSALRPPAPPARRARFHPRTESQTR